MKKNNLVKKSLAVLMTLSVVFSYSGFALAADKAMIHGTGYGDSFTLCDADGNAIAVFNAQGGKYEASNVPEGLAGSNLIIKTADGTVHEVVLTKIGNGNDKDNEHGTDHYSITPAEKPEAPKPPVNPDGNPDQGSNTEVTPQETSAPVYVYLQAHGNWSVDGLKNLGVNKVNAGNGWFTIGKADVNGIAVPTAKGQSATLTDGQKTAVLGNLNRFADNSGFEVKASYFGNDIHAADGATDYAYETGYNPAYHYDGTVEFYQVEYKAGYGSNATLKKVDTLATGMDTPACEVPERKGYVFTGWDKEVSETVTGNVTYTAQWAESVYVYVKVLGNPSEETLNATGLTQVNKHGYCTLGVAAYDGEISSADKNIGDTVTADTAEVLKTLKKTHNTAFSALDLVTWEDIKVCDGADTMTNEDPFVPNGTNAYHLDGTIEFTSYDVVYYWMNGNDKVILNTSDETTGIVGQEVNVTPTEKIEVKNENGQKVIRLFAADNIPEGTYKPVSTTVITKKLASGKNTIEIECVKEAALDENGTTTPDNGGNTGGNDTPTVNPEDSEPAAPAEPAEDEITGDAPGSEALGAGGDVIDSDAMGNPDPIDADDAEEDIAATPKGVKTGDETAPWAMGFAGAIIALGGAVAARRRAEEE